MKNSGFITSITIPVSDMYSVLEYPDIQLGAEVWDNNDIPMPLRNLDSSVNRIDTCIHLFPKIEHIVNEISRSNPKDDVEKTLMLDVWFQRHIQYITGRKTTALGVNYICPNIHGSTLSENVLLNHFGRCEDIAFTAAAILNHPKINVKCRQISSDLLSHSLNIVSFLGNVYYMDFTRNITRNPDKYPEALKAKSYSPKFTLLGRCDVNRVLTPPVFYPRPHFSEKSFDREKIKQIILSLEMQKKLITQWDNEPVEISFIEKGDKTHEIGIYQQKAIP